MFTSTVVAAVFASAALASPIALTKRDAALDTTILQYALTLEHLENAFYSGALKKYNNRAFEKAGFPSWVRGRFEQISMHEQQHVTFLEGVLGSVATKPCQYNFPYHDPKSFAALSQVLEGVGVTAYLGAANLISNPEYLTAAGSILTTEARHAAWVASAVNKGPAWSGPFDVPLDFNQVYSLAAPFIVAGSCPSSNPSLPVKAFPGLTYTPASPAPGQTITLTFPSTSGSTYLALYTGLNVNYYPITNGKVQLPKGLDGTVYGVVTTSGSSVSDDNTVAGPAVFLFPDNE